jgi:hypothetical protein
MTYFIAGYGFMILCTWLAQPYSRPGLSAEEKSHKGSVHAICAVLWPITLTTTLICKLIND